MIQKLYTRIDELENKIQELEKWSDFMAQKYSIQLLTATTADWNASQYVVPEGELIAELQVDGKIQLKIGDGLHKFSDLPYVADKGPKGDAGVSPTVSTSKENGVATITIIDGSGERSFQVNDGKSPTISTSKLDGVATVTITDADGEHTFTVNDGVSPTVNTSKTDGIATVTITDESGEHIFTIKDGDKGEPFTFADLTDAQKLELKGDTGEGFVIKGTYDTLELLEAGVASPTPGIAYGVGTAAPYDIYIYDGVKSAWVNHGQLQGAKGETGAVFIPAVAENGDLSWSNNGGYTNPTTVNIKGVGIESIERTSGDGSPGTVDTYTITYTDSNTSTFNVTNGSDLDISGKLDLTGGTMTGSLILSGEPMTDLEAATKKYVDDLIGDVDAAMTTINNVIGGAS